MPNGDVAIPRESFHHILHEPLHLFFVTTDVPLLVAGGRPLDVNDDALI